MCVNMGQRQAVKILQQAINSRKMNKIEEDGVIGEITIENAGRISKERLQAYRCLFYGKLVSEEPEQERFYLDGIKGQQLHERNQKYRYHLWGYALPIT